MTSKEKLALIKETWYDVDLTDEKYIDFDEEQIFSDLEKDLERLEQIDNANPSEALKSLEELRDFRYGEDKLLVCQTEMYSIIKQVLLKVQKQDKILKILKEHYHILDINKSLNTIELSFKLEDKKFNLIKEFFKQ